MITREIREDSIVFVRGNVSCWRNAISGSYSWRNLRGRVQINPAGEILEKDCLLRLDRVNREAFSDLCMKFQNRLSRFGDFKLSIVVKDRMERIFWENGKDERSCNSIKISLTSRLWGSYLAEAPIILNLWDSLHRMFERLYSYVEESACLPVLTGSRCTCSHLRGVLLPPRSAGFFFHETLGHMLEADVRGLYPGENLIGMDERINVVDDVRGNEHLIGLAEVDDLACTMSPVSLVEQGHVRRLISIEYTMSENSSSDGFARASTCFEKPVPRMRVTQVLPVSPSDSDTLDLDGHWFSLEHALQGSVTPGTGEFKIIGSGFHMMNGERIGFNGSIMITGRLENILRKLVHIGSESSVYAADCGKMGQAVRVGYGAPMTALSGSTLKLAEPGAEN